MDQGKPNNYLEQGFSYAQHDTGNTDLELETQDSHTKNKDQGTSNGFSYMQHNARNTDQVLETVILIQETWIREHRTFTWNRDTHTRNRRQGTPNSHLEQV